MILHMMTESYYGAHRSDTGVAGGGEGLRGRGGRLGPFSRPTTPGVAPVTGPQTGPQGVGWRGGSGVAQHTYLKMIATTR